MILGFSNQNLWYFRMIVLMVMMTIMLMMMTPHVYCKCKLAGLTRSGGAEEKCRLSQGHPGPTIQPTCICYFHCLYLYLRGHPGPITLGPTCICNFHCLYLYFQGLPGPPIQPSSIFLSVFCYCCFRWITFALVDILRFCPL